MQLGVKSNCVVNAPWVSVLLGEVYLWVAQLILLDLKEETKLQWDKDLKWRWPSGPLRRSAIYWYMCAWKMNRTKGKLRAGGNFHLKLCQFWDIKNIFLVLSPSWKKIDLTAKWNKLLLLPFERNRVTNMAKCCFRLKNLGMQIRAVILGSSSWKP